MTSDGKFIAFTDNTHNECYFFIALGKHYIDECVFLRNTIRKHNDNRPVYLLLHEADLDYAKDREFDGVVLFDPSDDLWNDCVTDAERFCVYPRITLDRYIDQIPSNETITVDSDVACQYSADSIWNRMKEEKLPVRMTGLRHDDSWHWGTIKEVSEAYGKHVPHVHGGFFYLRKDVFLKEFFDYSRKIFYLYDDYKCKKLFRGGKVDEIIFAIAHSYFDIWPIEFDEFPIMTFNYMPSEQIPSKLQTVNGMFKTMNDFIPFVHMFDKPESEVYKVLYSKIMSA
jgi:hypothetical protein